MVETTHEGVWIADFAGVTLFANQQMARMLGSTPGEMIGRPVFEFVFEEDHAVVGRHFAEFLKGPGGKEVEERLRRKDGTELRARLAATLFRRYIASSQLPIEAEMVPVA